jgi:hypothetical protein
MQAHSEVPDIDLPATGTRKGAAAFGGESGNGAEGHRNTSQRSTVAPAFPEWDCSPDR